MKDFKSLANGNTVPLHNIIVFDEAQRAWDTAKEPGETEATFLLKLGDRIAAKFGKVTILCLIGDGQVIHIHEEKGMPLWVEALSNRSDWHVYVPDNYKAIFNGTPNLHVSSNFMLTTSIRHDFIDVSPWVEAILNLDMEKAKQAYREILAKGFECWRFRRASQLPKAVSYVRQNYPGAHTGIIVSSHLKARPEMFKTNGNDEIEYKGSYVKANDAYKWYTEECFKLKRGASEFLIQGIELEYPIVFFVGDYYIDNGKWTVDPNASNPGLENLEKVIQNIYRVLLTRSRQGMFLYFPATSRKLDETYEWFKSMLLLE